MATQLGLKEKDTKEYINILGSDGTFRKVVPEGTLGSVKREYETSDGKTGVKYEHIYKEVSGYITDMQFHDGDYGENIIIEIAISEDKEQKVYVSVSTGSSFGEDFMKKLPNINLDEIVTLSPYAFEDEKGKTRKGITVMQNGVKLTNYFYDADKKVNQNGYPNPKGDTKKYTKDKWKAYFLDARIFLTEYTTENFIEKVYGHTEQDKKDDF